MSRIPFLCLALVFALASPAEAKHKHPESYYRDLWCRDRGRAEVRLPDRTRCDCLTPTHAVEADFGSKFYEAIGQSLYYSLQTGKRAGVLLILERPKDRKYWLRLNSVIEHFNLPIDAWKMENF